MLVRRLRISICQFQILYFHEYNNFFRECRNGKLKYVLDEKCLEEKGFDCSKRSRHYKKIPCKGDRHRCEIVRESPDGEFPALGKCQGPSPGKLSLKVFHQDYIPLSLMFSRLKTDS